MARHTARHADKIPQRQSEVLEAPMRRLRIFAGLISVFLVPWSPIYAQSKAALQGRVVDLTGVAMAGVDITVRNRATGLERIVQTDGEGNYQVAALPVGAYRIEVRASGFQSQIVESLIVEVGLTAVQDFQLRLGDISQEVTVTAHLRPWSGQPYP